jgi:acetyl-CoA carboxylase carboxyltransferase component
LNNIVPFDPNKPYDMKIVLESIADRNQVYEIMPDYAKNILTGFAEVEGRVIGLVAN